MKSLNLKKLVAMALTLATVTAASPLAASAAWKQDNNGWWNTEGESWSVGWRQINGNWYHFDQTGYMNTGWVIDYSAGYGQWYFMDQSGAMKTGWLYDNGKWYFLQPSGAMQTGWINDNGTWYFADESGTMLANMTIKVDGETYYLQSNGSMVIGDAEINGIKYTFGTNGACIGSKPTAERIFGTNSSSNNSGNSSTDDKDTNNSDSNSSSSGGSHGGGGSHGSSNPQAIRDYNTSANITVENVSNEQSDSDIYKVRFKNDLNLKNSNDYVVRDLYVTNDGATITEEKDNNGTYYLVKVNKDSKLDIKGVTRVIRDGKVFYVTGIIVQK